MFAFQDNLTKIDKGDNFLYETLEEFLLEKKKRSENTFKTYKNGIDIMSRELFNCEYKYLRQSHLENLTIDDLIKYFNNLFIQEDDEYGERVYSNSTINLRQTIMKQTIKYLSARKKVKLKFDASELDVLIKTLPNDSEEIGIMELDEAYKYMNYFRNNEQENALEKYLIVKLAIDTALRASELLRLKWSQFQVIDGKHVMITSTGKNKGKGNKDYKKRISIELYEELKQLKHGERDNLFTINYRTLAYMIKRAVNHFGDEGKNYSFHTFRKVAISFMRDTVNDLQAVKEFACHSSLSTTEKYLKKKEYNMVGAVSLGDKLDNDLYKKVSHEELVGTLEKMNKDFLYLLNIKLLENTK